VLKEREKLAFWCTSIRGHHKTAGWDHDFLIGLIAGTAV
jgi:hypothetical protein